MRVRFVFPLARSFSLQLGLLRAFERRWVEDVEKECDRDFWLFKERSTG